MAKFYYNGVLLPEIPQDVLAEYPYCWIRKNTTSGNYDLVFGKQSWYYNNGVYCQNETDEKWYTIPIATSTDATAWNFNKTTTGSFGVDTARFVFWSNHNIPNGSATSATIYFVGSEPIVESPSNGKYLIRSQGVLYTINDGALSPLETTELTSDIFQSYGFDKLPEWSVVSELVNPEILYWQDVTNDLPTMTATMTATPLPQTVVSPNYDMSDSTILGVECAYVTASSDVVFAISVDDGVTWYMWTGETWGILTDATTGMSADTINAITTEQWAGLTTTGQFKVRMTLFDENSSFTSFVMDYIN